MKKRGVDWIDVSSGGVSPLQKIPLSPGYQVPFAKDIKAATGLTTMAVGLITDPKQAEEIIASGKADMIALARGMLYDPRWGWHAAAKLGAAVTFVTCAALVGATGEGTVANCAAEALESVPMSALLGAVAGLNPAAAAALAAVGSYQAVQAAKSIGTTRDAPCTSSTDAPRRGGG